MYGSQPKSRRRSARGLKLCNVIKYYSVTQVSNVCKRRQCQQGLRTGKTQVVSAAGEVRGILIPEAWTVEQWKTVPSWGANLSNALGLGRSRVHARNNLGQKRVWITEWHFITVWGTIHKVRHAPGESLRMCDSLWKEEGPKDHVWCQAYNFEFL